jgi:hypothetical protein
MPEVGQRRQVEQDERELERIPAPDGRDVDRLGVGRLAAPHALCEDRPHPLLPHRAVHESEGLGGLWVSVQDGQARLYARERFGAAGDGLCRDVLVPFEPGSSLSDAAALALDPRAVRAGERTQPGAELPRLDFREGLHVQQDLRERRDIVRRRRGHLGDVGHGNDGGRAPDRPIGR